MKTSQIFLALSLITTIANAQTTVTSGINSEADQWLTKKLSSSANTNDHQIKYVDKHYVDKVLKDLDNKASVDFSGNGDKSILKTSPKKLSGVLVGSGDDQLIATGSADNTGPIVVQPPVIPKTSLTVVGRLGAGQVGQKICVKRFVTDEQGKIQKAGMTIPNNSCVNLNIPLRISEGFYQVFFKDAHDVRLGIGMLVKIEANENKVIPLREISVPENAQHNIGFILTEEKNSEFYLRSFATESFAYNIASDVADSTSPEELYQRDYAQWIGRNVWLDQRAIDETLMSDSMMNSRMPGGNFVSVFPGVYQIDWLIDGQTDETKDINVQ
jgi:hypothetical protein